MFNTGQMKRTFATEKCKSNTSCNGKNLAVTQPNGVKFEFPFLGLIGSVNKTSLITPWVWIVVVNFNQSKHS